MVSAYRDKLERYTDKYYKEFGIHMVKRYREQALQKFPPEEFPVGYDLDGEEVRKFVQNALFLSLRFSDTGFASSFLGICPVHHFLFVQRKSGFV